MRPYRPDLLDCGNTPLYNIYVYYIIYTIYIYLYTVYPWPDLLVYIGTCMLLNTYIEIEYILHSPKTSVTSDEDPTFRGVFETLPHLSKLSVFGIASSSNDELWIILKIYSSSLVSDKLSDWGIVLKHFKISLSEIIIFLHMLAALQ